MSDQIIAALEAAALHPNPQDTIWGDRSAIYGPLLAESPVVYLPQLKVWLVMGSLVNQLLKDKRLSANRLGPVLARIPDLLGVDYDIYREGAQHLNKTLSTMFAFMDGSDHDLLRKVAEVTINMDHMQAYEDSIRDNAETLAQLLAETPSTVYVARQFASPIAVHGISGLVGFPVKDGPQLMAWSGSIASIIGKPPSKELVLQTIDSLQSLRAYLADLEKTNHDTNTLIGYLQTTNLDEITRVAVNVSMITGGIQTTAAAITTIIELLSRHPAAWEYLRANYQDPVALRSIVAELMRIIGGAIDGAARIALEDIVISTANGDVTIPAGSLVRLSLYSANHDPALFADPETLDFNRPNMRKSLVYGAGSHTCIGWPLANIEIDCALGAFAGAIASYKVAPDVPLSYSPQIAFSGLSEVAITDIVPAK